MALAGVLLSLAAAAFATRPNSQAGGPFLRDGPLVTDGQDVAGTPALINVPIVYAGVNLFNTGDQPIVLESARLYPSPREMPQVAGYVVPPGRRMNAVEFTSWPHSANVLVRASLRGNQPLPRATLDPTRLHPLEQGDELLLVLRPTRTGDHTAPYVYVRYRVGNTQYAELLPRGVVVCARRNVTPNINCDHRFPHQTIAPRSVLGG